MAGVCAPGDFCIVVLGETNTNMHFNTTCLNGKKSTKVWVMHPPQNRFGNELISRCGYNSMSASIFHTQAYTPPVFLKHVHPPLQSPKPPHFCSPPSSPTLTLCVIQSSQGDGYPSPRSAYALHFLKRLIRLIDCPPPCLCAPSADSV